MVDSVNNSGNSQNISQVNRTQNNRNSETRRSEGTTAPQDEVQISEEALSISEAERTASETRTILEEQLDEVLSNDRGRLDTLI